MSAQRRSVRMNPGRRGQRRVQRMVGGSVLHTRDYNSQRVVCAQSPPTRSLRPAVQRVVRLTGVYTCTQATPTPTINASYLDVATQDGIDYRGVGTARYQTMRIDSVKTWVGAPRTNVAPSSTGAPAAPTEVVLYDLVATGDTAAYSDVMSSGVDWTSIGYKPSLTDRSAWELTSNATNFTQLTMTTPGLGPTDNVTGQYVMDILVTFR